MRRLLCLVLGACALHAGWAQATGQDLPPAGGRPVPRASFELSSDMVGFDAPSTRLFLGWQRDAESLFEVGFDGAARWLDLGRPDQGALRFGVLALFTGAGMIVTRAFSITAHDEAHMEAARSIGATDVMLVRADTGQEMSVWEFLVDALDFTAEPGLYQYTKSAISLTEEAYVSGEGLDTNMLIAAAVAQKIRVGDGHVTDLAPYVLNKLWGIPYFQETGPTSDAANYMSALNAQGYPTVTRVNVIALNIVSCAASGAFLALAEGTWDFVADGDAAVKPVGFRLGDLFLFWPELTTWLNPDSVSLQVTTAASWDVFVFHLDVDSPVLGNISPGPELTLGVRARLSPFVLRAEVTSHFVGLPFFLGSVEVGIGSVYSLSVEGYDGQRNTWRELREFPLGPGAAIVLTARL